MSLSSPDSLRTKKCLPCEGGVAVISREDSKQYAAATPKWIVDDEAKMIYRKVNCQNFVEAIGLINRIGEVAEAEQHHPDLHLTGYRKLRIDLTTHAIGGLSENDFILAAKIDEFLP